MANYSFLVLIYGKKAISEASLKRVYCVQRFKVKQSERPVS